MLILGLLLTTSLTAAWVHPAGTWIPPVPLHITRGFDRPVPNWLPGHRGVDLAARPGQLVRSAGDGTVIWAGILAGRGVVVVGHQGGLRTTYEPVTSSVVAGEQVHAGELLGTIGRGQTHCDGHCLHWGLRRGLEYLNPLLLLGLGHARLIPIQEVRSISSRRQPVGLGVGEQPSCASDRCVIPSHPAPDRSRQE